MEPWQIKKTACFPCSWKVFPIHTYRERNDTSNFFEDEALANKEAKRRNHLEGEQ